MPKNEYLDVEKILGTMDSLVESGLRCPHAEPERALENMASSLLALVSEAHAGIARIRVARNMRTSGAARLSQEAITTVVLFLDRFEDRLTACQVCHLWRAVALEIPSPWPRISCTVRHENPVAGGRKQNIFSALNFRSRPREIDAQPTIIISDLKRLAMLCYAPGRARFSVQLQLEVSCKDPFAGSSGTHMGAADVRKRILRGLHSLTGPITRETVAAAFSLEDDLFLDALHPLVTAADRISSLMIDVNCENWLAILLCLPVMPALRILSTTSQNVILPSHNALLRVLLSSGLPELPVRFPALRYLKVANRSAKFGRDIPHISSCRIASLLECMPKLRYLDLNLPVWPHLEAPRPGDNFVEAPLQLQSDARPNLKSIILASSGAYSFCDTGCAAMEELLKAVRIEDNGVIEYRTAACTSYEAGLSAFARGYFLPTSLTTIFWPEIIGGDSCLRVEATNASGCRRIVRTAPRRPCTWTGHLLGRYIRTTRLTSLTLNIAAWSSLADGFDVHTVERLEIVIDENEFAVWPSETVPVVFGPAASRQIGRAMYLPALETLAFGIHHSAWQRLRDRRIMDTHLNVPISVLTAGILTVSQSGALVGNLVIGKGIRPTADAEDPDVDPIAELRALSQSLVIL